MTLQLRTDELEWKQIDDEIVALDGREATYLAVNGSGALLWQALARGATRDELIAALCRAYGLDEVRASVDADAFLAALSEQGLLAA